MTATLPPSQVPAVPAEEEKISFKEIWTHPEPDMDEMVAIWLLITFGEEKFSGISNTEFLFKGAYDIKILGKSADDLEKEGILCVGIGGGRFDEHPFGCDDKRKSGKSAATLVADALELRDNPDVRNIIDFASTVDLGSVTVDQYRDFLLDSLAKDSFRYTHKDDHYSIIQAVFVLIGGKWRQNRSFMLCKNDFEKTSRCGYAVKQNGAKVKIVSVISDNLEMPKYCRSKWGGYAGVVIKISPKTGKIQILADRQRLGGNLDPVARAVRIAERQANGLRNRVPENQLVAEGEVEGADVWYYFPGGGMLFNSTPKNPNVPKTKLSREKVEQIVLDSLQLAFDNAGC